MTTFEIDWVYTTEVFGTDIVEADDRQTAEDMLVERIQDERPLAKKIEVDAVREVTDARKD